jgi:hypothetical protein
MEDEKVRDMSTGPKLLAEILPSTAAVPTMLFNRPP